MAATVGVVVRHGYVGILAGREVIWLVRAKIKRRRRPGRVLPLVVYESSMHNWYHCTDSILTLLLPGGLVRVLTEQCPLQPARPGHVRQLFAAVDQAFGRVA